jgi:hypothetical protein
MDWQITLQSGSLLLLIWLLDHPNLQQNQGQVHNLLCGWFQAQTGEDRVILFDYAVSKRLFRFDLLLGGQLDVLLPLANAYQDPTVFNAIVCEIKSSISKWRQAISSKASPELWQLSWDRIVQAFDLHSYPRPPVHPSRLANEMKLAHRHLDSICEAPKSGKDTTGTWVKSPSPGCGEVF